MTRRILVAAVAFAMAIPALLNVHSASAQAKHHEPQIDTMSDAERAVLLQAARAKAEELQRQLDEKSAPFDEEYTALSAELTAAQAPFRLRLEAIADEKFKGLEDWKKEQLAFNERRNAATQSLRTDKDTVEKNLEAATASQVADWRAVQAQLAELRKKGAKFEDSESKDARARAESIARDYQAKAAPFEQEMTQFDDKIQAVNETFRPENAALWKKRHDLIDSCDSRSRAVGNERDVAVAHLRSRGWDIVNRKHAAVGALQQAVVDANFEVFSLTPRSRAQ